jgi:phosphoribosylaminoimidazole carboxylase PurE protein
MSSDAQVLIVMGSDSDLDVMSEAKAVLDELGISSKMTIASAHRSPARALRLAEQARREGFQVIIAGAGAAAHLAGVMAAHTILPVIGVPIDSSPLRGWDSLLSIVQMPAGVPVATMAVGKAGARNAGFLAAQILGLTDRSIQERLIAWRADQLRKIENRAAALEEGGQKK